MKIICRSLDITCDEVRKILENGYNDLTSLILRLSKHGTIDYYCIRNILEFINAENLILNSEISEILNGDDFLYD